MANTLFDYVHQMNERSQGYCMKFTKLCKLISDDVRKGESTLAPIIVSWNTS
jgi:hypothetical protein